MATVALNNGVISVDGAALTSREDVIALEPVVITQIVDELYKTIPASIREDMTRDNEDGARLISGIAEYLGKFNNLVTDMLEKYAEYGGIILFQALASSHCNDKVLNRKYETVKQLGLQYFNNIAGLQKLVLGLKGTADEPAMTADAITAQNQFAKGTRS